MTTPKFQFRLIFLVNAIAVTVTMFLALSGQTSMASTVINGVTLDDASYQIVSDEFLKDGTFNTTRQTTDGIFTPTVCSNDVPIVVENIDDMFEYGSQAGGNLIEQFNLIGGIEPRLQLVTQYDINQYQNILITSQSAPKGSIYYYFLPVAKPGAPNVTTIPVQIVVSGEARMFAVQATGNCQCFVGMPFGFVPESYTFTAYDSGLVITNFTITQVGNVPLNSESSVLLSINGQAYLSTLSPYPGAFYPGSYAGVTLIIDPTIIVDPSWPYHDFFTVIQSQNLFSAPTLQASLQGTNLVLSWPTAVYGYSLECSSNISPSTVWSAITNTPVEINGQNVVTNSISGSSMFFRLNRP